jgi:hypothetical protein
MTTKRMLAFHQRGLFDAVLTQFLLQLNWAVARSAPCQHVSGWLGCGVQTEVRRLSFRALALGIIINLLVTPSYFDTAFRDF